MTYQVASLEKNILKARIEGNREKGRQTRWENDIVNWMKTTIESQEIECFTTKKFEKQRLTNR